MLVLLSTTLAKPAVVLPNGSLQLPAAMRRPYTDCSPLRGYDCSRTWCEIIEESEKFVAGGVQIHLVGPRALADGPAGEMYRSRVAALKTGEFEQLKELVEMVRIHDENSTVSEITAA